jgi:DNA-binding transcriptional MerR regulator
MQSNNQIQLPDKLFFTIGEVSKLTGIKPYILRYWESEFKELRPNRNLTKQRIYRRKDIEFILYVKKLLYEEKYTIEGVKQKLKNEKGMNQPSLFKNEKSDILIKIKEELNSLLNFLNSRNFSNSN